MISKRRSKRQAKKITEISDKLRSLWDELVASGVNLAISAAVDILARGRLPTSLEVGIDLSNKIGEYNSLWDEAMYLRNEVLPDFEERLKEAREKLRELKQKREECRTKQGQE